MSNTVIEIENLSKQYRLGYISAGTVRGDFQRWISKVRGKEDPFLKIGSENTLSKTEGEYVWALQDINLKVEEGEVLGIIGKNGAGKSTLLKILSRVTGPTTGVLKVKGRIASLLEVGTGFHPELTGRENIFLNGAILGMKKPEIRSKLEEIVEFAGVRKYIDTPVKRYSSGMHVRLAFAVAAHLEPDILVVDEVLAVGDAEFQKKAIGKMQDVSRSQGRTVLFVSHNMGAVSQLCSKAVLLEFGKKTFEGNVDKTIDLYLSGKKETYFSRSESASNDKDAYFEEIKIVDENLNEKTDFFYNEPVYVKYKIRLKKKIDPNYSVFCTVLDKKSNRVFSSESKGIKSEMILEIRPEFLVRGNYSIHTFIHIPRIKQEDAVENVCPFTIIDNGSDLLKHGGYDYGNVFGATKWS